MVNAQERLSRGYARRLTPNPEGGYTASIQEFPGVVAEGDSAEEALKNLDSAAEAWIEAVQNSGQRVPEAIDLGGFSGRIALRLPRGLHKRAAEMASAEGVSLNQWFTAAIGHYLGTQEAVGQAVDQICTRILPLLSSASGATTYAYISTVSVSLGPVLTDAAIHVPGPRGSITISNDDVLSRGMQWLRLPSTN
jgi:predicted RNase H-like HicB family nuclease